MKDDQVWLDALQKRRELMTEEERTADEAAQEVAKLEVAFCVAALDWISHHGDALRAEMESTCGSTRALLEAYDRVTEAERKLEGLDVDATFAAIVEGLESPGG
jgi:hypothetical protein